MYYVIVPYTLKLSGLLDFIRRSAKVSLLILRFQYEYVRTENPQSRELPVDLLCTEANTPFRCISTDKEPVLADQAERDCAYRNWTGPSVSCTDGFYSGNNNNNKRSNSSHGAKSNLRQHTHTHTHTHTQPLSGKRQKRSDYFDGGGSYSGCRTPDRTTPDPQLAELAY